MAINNTLSATTFAFAAVGDAGGGVDDDDDDANIKIHSSPQIASKARFPFRSDPDPVIFCPKICS